MPVKGVWRSICSTAESSGTTGGAEQAGRAPRGDASRDEGAPDE